jgi:hypothetical protein
MNYKEDYPSRGKKQPPKARKMKKDKTAFGHKRRPLVHRPAGKGCHFYTIGFAHKTL